MCGRNCTCIWFANGQNLKMTNSIPALLIGFNRPKLLKQSLDAIVKSGITKLFVSLDGPRIDSHSDVANISECIKIVNSFESDFETVAKRFSGINSGCKIGVKQAIDWFFENNEFGIVVEDDVLISKEFVEFCKAVNLRFSNSEAVWQINGWTPFNFKEACVNPYITRYPQVWGWATWTRKWKAYNSIIGGSSLNEPSKLATNLKFVTTNNFDTYWSHNFNRVKNGLDTWDFQWVNTIWENGGVAISPPSRLTQNIGFGNDATHTKKSLPRHNLGIEFCEISMEIPDVNKLLDFYHGFLLYDTGTSIYFPNNIFKVRFELQKLFLDKNFIAYFKCIFFPGFAKIYFTKSFIDFRISFFKSKIKKILS